MPFPITFSVAAVALLLAAPVERWREVKHGLLDGEVITVSVDDTWPRSPGGIRSSHWQLVFVIPRKDGTKEVRFVDKVDCDRERRAPTVIEKYNDAGMLISRVEHPLSDLKWVPIERDSPQEEADGWACLNGPPVK